LQVPFFFDTGHKLSISKNSSKKILLTSSETPIEPKNRQYRTSKMNQVFSLISRDKGEKEKNSSTLNEDESCLVAESIELSNHNEFIIDFLKVIEF